MIKKDIKIKIITGKFKGKISNIKRCIPKKNMVIIENMNIVKKHIKADKKNNRGKIINKEMPIDISNIKYVKT